MKTIEIKADKKYIDYINRLLQDINFDDDSLEMQKLVIWKKGKTELDYREVACLECNFEIGDITLEKEYFDFLNKDYTIKFIY